MPSPLTYSSLQVRLYGNDMTVAHFHPNWSSGTAGVFGTKQLDGRRYYWELHLSQRVFGTSIMFGVATKDARIHADTFKNLLGEDAHGWGLSHKGLLWHNGRWSHYTQPFRENQATVIGLLYDGVEGTLTYYKVKISPKKVKHIFQFNNIPQYYYITSYNIFNSHYLTGRTTICTKVMH